MEKLLKNRVLLITLIFALFGGALPKLLQIDELQSYYTSLTPLLALVVSFFISFMLKAKWSVKWRNKLKAISAVLMVALLVLVYFHTYVYLRSTFRCDDFEGKEGSYVKGDTYTANAKDYMIKNPKRTEDCALVEDFGGTEHKKEVWTSNSINENLLGLISTYVVLVIVLVGFLSMLLEILALNYSKSNAKLAEGNEQKWPKSPDNSPTPAG